MPTALLTRTAQLPNKTAALIDTLTTQLIRRPVPTAQTPCRPSGEFCIRDDQCCEGLTCQGNFGNGGNCL